MRVPRLQSCCCGCSLRQGSATVAVLFAVWELMELVSYSTLAEEELLLQHENGKYTSSYRTLLIVGATVAALLLLSNVLLLLGVHKSRASLLLPWLLVYSVLTCLSLAVIWLTVYAVFKHTDFLDAVGMLALSLFKAALVVYCILVVYSFYCSLKEKDAPPPPYQPPPPYTLWAGHGASQEQQQQQQHGQ